MEVQRNSIASQIALNEMQTKAESEIAVIKDVDIQVGSAVKDADGFIGTIQTKSNTLSALVKNGTPTQKKAFEKWKETQKSFTTQMKTWKEGAKDLTNDVRDGVTVAEKSGKKIAQMVTNEQGVLSKLFKGTRTIAERLGTAKKHERSITNLKGTLVARGAGIVDTGTELRKKMHSAWRVCRRQVDTLGKLDAAKQEITRDIRSLTKNIRSENFRQMDAPLAKMAAAQERLNELEKQVANHPDSCMNTPQAKGAIDAEIRSLEAQIRAAGNEIRTALPVAERITTSFQRVFGSKYEEVTKRQDKLLETMTAELPADPAAKKEALNKRSVALEKLIKNSPQQAAQDVRAIVLKLVSKIESNDQDTDSIKKLERFLGVINGNADLRSSLSNDPALSERIAKIDGNRQDKLLESITAELPADSAERKEALEKRGMALDKLTKESPQQAAQDTRAIVSKLVSKIEINNRDTESIEKLERFLDVINGSKSDNVPGIAELRTVLFKDEALRGRIADIHNNGLLWEEAEDVEQPDEGIEGVEHGEVGAVAEGREGVVGVEQPPKKQDMNERVISLGRDIRSWKGLELAKREVDDTALELQRTKLNVGVAPGSKLDNALTEVVTTETTFIENMHVLHGLLTSLKSEGEPKLTKEERALVEELSKGFEDISALEHLLKVTKGKTGAELLNALTNAFSSPQMGAQFAKLGQLVGMYSEKLALISGENEKLLNKIMDKRANLQGVKGFKDKGLTLASFLIMPVQRATRYDILLKAAVEQADKEKGGLVPDWVHKFSKEPTVEALTDCYDLARYHGALLNLNQ